MLLKQNKIKPKKSNKNKTFFKHLSPIFLSPTSLGSNPKQSKKLGDKWYKVIEHNMNASDCCSDLDENELTDEEDLNNNNVNNQSLLSNYKSNENASTAHSNCARDFFDCLRFRRNYKRNRKKCGKGQSASYNKKIVSLPSQIVDFTLQFSLIAFGSFNKTENKIVLPSTSPSTHKPNPRPPIDNGRNLI